MRVYWNIISQRIFELTKPGFLRQGNRFFVETDMINKQGLETMILQNMGSRQLQRFAQPLTLIVRMDAQRFNMTRILPCPADTEANRFVIGADNN